MTIQESENEYTSYITSHIEMVKLVWKELQSLLTGEYWLDDKDWWNIDTAIEAHDKSKYSDVEFEGYRQYFYTADNEEKNRYKFEIAMSNHIHNNPHHWQYWEINDFKIPFQSIIEMLCDWTAMSVKNNNEPSTWFAENKNNIVLSVETDRMIQRWLPLFDKIYYVLKEEL